MRRFFSWLFLICVTGFVTAQNEMDFVRVYTHNNTYSFLCESLDSITHDGNNNVIFNHDELRNSFAIADIDSISFEQNLNYLCVINSVDDYWNHIIYDNQNNYVCVKKYNVDSKYAIGFFDNSETAISLDSASNIVSVETENLRSVIDYMGDTIVINTVSDGIETNDTIYIGNLPLQNKTRKRASANVNTGLSSYLVNYYADKSVPGLSNLVGFLRATDDMSHQEKLNYIVDMYDNWDSYLAEYLLGLNPSGLSIPQDIWQKILDRLKGKIPSCSTGECLSTTDKSAVVQCSDNYVPRGAVCGVMTSSEDETKSTKTGSYNGEREISLTGLTPVTTYNYWAYIEIDGIPTNGEVRNFTTNLPDISGTWNCTEYLSDGSVYETFTVTLNSDGSAEATENYGMFSGTSHGSWSIGSGGHVGVSLIYYSYDTQWAGKSLSGVVDNMNAPSTIEGTSYYYRGHVMGGSAEYTHKLVMTR